MLFMEMIWGGKREKAYTSSNNSDDDDDDDNESKWNLNRHKEIALSSSAFYQK